jgi:serine/threonine-protein phosphatase 2A regulatory subunit A
MPMVKSDAYKNLVPLLDSLDDVTLATEFVSPLLESLSKELIESMRQSIVDIVAKLAERAHALTYPTAKSDETDEKASADKEGEVIPGAGDGAKVTGGIKGDAQTLTMNFLQFAVEDDSWRVRKYCAQKIANLAYFIKPSVVSSDVRQLYVKLLSDTEPQVRKAAIGTLEKLLACSEGEKFASALAGKSGPISSLVSDSVAEVREALAENIAYLGKHLTATGIADVFLPSLKKLASDDSPLARLNLCSKLSIICGILGIEQFSTEILPLLKEVTIDQRWRVRNSVVQNLADIGIQMGSSKFGESRLKEILIQSLKDPAATVRDTACEQVRKLHKEFGHEWMTKHFFEQMISIYKDSGNYLHRMVPLKAIKLMAPELTGAQIRTDFANLLLQALKDPISNVRFTACRVLIVVLPKVDSTISGKFTTLLEQLATSDEDEDVVYFAQEALRVAR